MRYIDPALKQKIILLVEGLGYCFWGCELISHARGGVVLRVYIDGLQNTAVHSEDCVLVSRQLGALLDVEDAIQGRYTMEVSSPGVDRVLFTLAHFTQYIGHRVAIRLRTPVSGQRQFTGRIHSVENDTIHLHTESSQMTLHFNDIDHAHVIAELRF